MTTDPTRIGQPGENPPSDQTAEFSTDTPPVSQSPQTQSDTKAESNNGATGEWSQQATRDEGPDRSNATANFTAGPVGRRAAAVLQTSLGGYEIQGELGRGGMGVVYKAHQRGLNRTVALKMVLAGVHASEEQLKRFLAEARAVAHLQHPNIVQVFDIGENDGMPFFSLEFVDGDPLSKKLAKQPQPPKEAAALLVTIAKAMQYAHDNKILHRDLKPANILMTLAGAPKIADFGLAKQIEDTEEDGATRTGTVIGTPSYMAPEQARGDTHNIGPATDQYSLGAMLYEMLTGRPPFAAARQVDTVLQVIKNEPIPPRQLEEKIPADLETICLKALQKDIAKRYGSCGEFADDLGRFLRGEPIVARPVGQVERAIRWCRRNPLVAGLSGTAVLLLLLATGISTWAAITFSSKNAELASKNIALADQTAKAKKSEAEAIDSQKLAEARKAEAEGQARNAEGYVRQFLIQVRLGMDDIEAPQIRPFRDRLLQMAMDTANKVLEQLAKSKDAQAVPMKMAIEGQMADAYKEKGQSAKAGELLQQLVVQAEKRLPFKGYSDASRNNLVLFLMALAENKRDFDRDLGQSMELIQRAHLLAQEIVANHKTDEAGNGRQSDSECQKLVGDTHWAMATTYYRIGNPQLAEKHFRLGLALYERVSKEVDQDQELKKKTPPEQQAFRQGLQQALQNQHLPIGSALFRSGKFDEAEPYLKTAYEQVEKAWSVEANKKRARLRLSYIGRAGMRAEFMAQHGRTADAMPLLESAAKAADDAIVFDPDGLEVRRNAAVAYYRLGQWREELAMGDAKEMYKKTLQIRADFAAKDPDNQKRKIELTLALGRTGDFAKTDEIASALAKNEKADSEMLLDLARGIAQASKHAPAEQKAQFLAKAVAMVKRAADQKFRDLVYLEKEIDFKPLWELPEFKAITAEIRASAPAIDTAAPAKVE